MCYIILLIIKFLIFKVSIIAFLNYLLEEYMLIFNFFVDKSFKSCPFVYLELQQKILEIPRVLSISKKIAFYFVSFYCLVAKSCLTLL